MTGAEPTKGMQQLKVPLERTKVMANMKAKMVAEAHLHAVVEPHPGDAAGPHLGAAAGAHVAAAGAGAGDAARLADVARVKSS